jgi:spore germination protein
VSILNIYVVQPGDSVYAIARKYGVSPQRITVLNELDQLPHLVVGQALVIPSTERAYTVQSGDTLWSISKKFGVSVDSIVTLNNITSPSNISIGMTLRIPEFSKNYGYIEVNGYIEPSTAEKETAIINDVGAFLTYLSPFSYHVNSNGTLTPINDTAILQASRKFRIAPLLVVTNFSGANFDTVLIDQILSDIGVQQQLISNIISIMRAKNYYGINVDFERISPENRQLYNDFLKRLTDALHPLGYVVSTALAPKPSDFQAGAWHGAHDYQAHGEIVDFVIIMTYEWGWSGGPPYAVAPIDLVEDVIRYAATVIPPKKIMMGMPLYGYDWLLPYMPRGTWAKRVSPQDALKLAARYGSTIQFDEKTQSPFFYYYDTNKVQHVVWFEDARSVRAKFLLASRYGLRGVSYWVLGEEFPQNWALLNDMFNIVKVAR